MTGLAAIDIAGLPATRWRLGDEPPLVLDVPVPGVLLGTARDGARVTARPTAPQPLRLGVVGSIGLARLLAHRLLGAGITVTAATATPPVWGRLRQLSDGRLGVVQQRASWPPVPADPPGVGTGPQALVVDLPTPPPRWIGRAPWCTVVHVVPRVPAGAEFWAGVEEVLVAGRGHGQVLSHLLGNPQVARADELATGEAAVCSRTRFVPFRPMVGPTESELITDHTP